MSAVTRRERIMTATMDPTYDGGYVMNAVSKWAWRCEGCGNVWSRKTYAEDCESRKHRMAWFQRYISGPIVNGQPQHVRFYIRKVLRRERLVPTAAHKIDPIMVNPAFGG